MNRKPEDFKFKPITSDATEDSSFTVSYSTEAKAWAAVHDYWPNLLVTCTDGLFSFKDRLLYKSNSGAKGVHYGRPVVASYIDVIFNEQANQTKLSFNVNWQAEVIEDGHVQYDKTFTSAIIYNSIQCSGERIIEYLRNTKNVKGTWNFNDFLDLVDDNKLPFFDDEVLIETNINNDKPYYLKKKFIDKYLVVRFIFDNIDSNEIRVYSVNASQRAI